MNNSSKNCTQQKAISEDKGFPERKYDSSFVVSDSYRKSLPDVQNANASQIIGSNVPILKVGISNFKLPLKFVTLSSDTISLETSIVGSVSLDAG